MCTVPDLLGQVTVQRARDQMKLVADCKAVRNSVNQKHPR